MEKQLIDNIILALIEDEVQILLEEWIFHWILKYIFISIILLADKDKDKYCSGSIIPIIIFSRS